MDLFLRPNRYPGWVLAFGIVLTFAFATGLPRLGIDSAVSTMFVEGDPDELVHDEKTAIFGDDDVLLIAFETKSFGPQTINVISEAVEAIERIEFVESTESIATSSTPFLNGDMIAVGSLKQAISELDQAISLDALRSAVLGHPAWRNRLVNHDISIAVIEVTFEATRESKDFRDAAVTSVEEALHVVDGLGSFVLAGHSYMKREIGRAIMRDLLVLVPPVLVALFALAGIFSGSFSLSLVMVLLIVAAEIWMCGAMGWLGIPITALSNTTPIVLIVLSTAQLMHIAAAWRAAETMDRTRRSGMALERVRRPSMIAGATTIAGYLSLSFSDVPIVRTFGQALALGVAASTVISIWVFPALLTLVPPPLKVGALGDSIGAGPSLFNLVRISNGYRGLILVASLILGAVCLFFATTIEIDSSGPKKFREDSDFRKASEYFKRNFGGDVVANVYVREPGKTFAKPNQLRRLESLQKRIDALPEVASSVSIADLVKYNNRLFLGEGSGDKIPDTEAAITQHLLLLDTAERDGTSRLISDAHDEARLLFWADIASSSHSASVRRRMAEIADAVFPKPAVTQVVSTEVLLSKAADTVAGEQLRAFGIALLAVLVVVAIGLRSLRDGLLTLVPNVLPLVLILGAIGSLGVPLNESTAVFAAATIGIAVDSSVHLLSMFRSIESRVGSKVAAAAGALTTTGRPVVVTSLLIVGGFLVFAFSDFQSVAELGVLTAATMTLCLAADLMVLPPLLLLGHSSPGVRVGLYISSRACAVVWMAKNGEKARFVNDGSEVVEAGRVTWI